MFEVRCIVGDKKLADMLRLLQPIALEPPVVIPAKVNGLAQAKTAAQSKVGNNQYSKDNAIRMASSDFLREIIAKRDPKFVSISKDRTLLKTVGLNQRFMSHGYGSNTYCYALAQLRKSGEIRKTKEPSVHEIVRVKGKL